MRPTSHLSVSSLTRGTERPPAISLDRATKRFPCRDGGERAGDPWCQPFLLGRRVRLDCGTDQFRQVDDAVAGLRSRPPSRARRRVEGKPVTGIPQGLGYMFQSGTGCCPGGPCSATLRLGPSSAGRRRQTPASRPGTGWSGWGSPASSATTRTSSPAGCASAVALAQTLSNTIDRDGRAVQRASTCRPADYAGDLLLACGPAAARPSSSSPTTWRRRSRWPTGSSCMTAGAGDSQGGFLQVGLPRPRDVEEVRLDRRFLDIYRRGMGNRLAKKSRSRARTGATRRGHLTLITRYRQSVPDGPRPRPP